MKTYYGIKKYLIMLFQLNGNTALIKFYHTALLCKHLVCLKKLFLKMNKFANLTQITLIKTFCFIFKHEQKNYWLDYVSS